MANAKKELRDRLCAMQDSIRTTQQPQNPSQEQKMRDCLAMLDQALSQVDQIHTNHFEDIDVGEDSKYMMVSTIGNLINAKNVRSSARSWVIAGQMSEITAQSTIREISLASRDLLNTDGTGVGESGEASMGSAEQRHAEAARQAFHGMGRQLRHAK